MNRPDQPLVHVSSAVFCENQILLVQESKPDVYGQWNLPGGHVERGERIVEAAGREVREETGLSVQPSRLIGVYTGPNSIRFVLSAQTNAKNAHPGDDILAVAWFSLAHLRTKADEWLTHAPMLRSILADLERGDAYPLELFRAVAV